MEKRTQTVTAGTLLARFGSQQTVREYQDNENIYSQGDAASAMFYVASGHVKLTVKSIGGKKVVLAILGKGDFFGENCLLPNPRRTTTATALQRSTVACVKRAHLSSLIRRDRTSSSLFIGDLLLRIERIQEDFTDQLLNPSERRLARILLRLSQLGKSGGADFAALHVTQGTLAEMVGTTRSRISHFMNRFRELGFIEYNGGLHVHRALRAFLLHA